LAERLRDIARRINGATAGVSGNAPDQRRVNYQWLVRPGVAAGPKKYPNLSHLKSSIASRTLCIINSDFCYNFNPHRS
jgi:hypothetical protein